MSDDKYDTTIRARCHKALEQRLMRIAKAEVKATGEIWHKKTHWAAFLRKVFTQYANAKDQEAKIGSAETINHASFM